MGHVWLKKEAEWGRVSKEALCVVAHTHFPPAVSRPSRFPGATWKLPTVVVPKLVVHQNHTGSFYNLDAWVTPQTSESEWLGQGSRHPRFLKIPRRVPCAPKPLSWGFKTTNTTTLNTSFQDGHVHLIPRTLPIISQHCSREPLGWRGKPELGIPGFKPSFDIYLVMDPELLSVLASIRFSSLISETTSNL